MCNLLMSVVWLLILIFVSFWVASIAVGFYIFILPLTVCITPLTKMANIIFSIIWLIILIFIAFWIAGIAAGLYIIILPFTVCIEALSGLTDFLLSVVQFPRYCAQSMMDGRGFN